jgi:tetratricopeptide (TPR) repeat protein
LQGLNPRLKNCGKCDLAAHFPRETHDIKTSDFVKSPDLLNLFSYIIIWSQLMKSPLVFGLLLTSHISSIALTLATPTAVLANTPQQQAERHNVRGGERSAIASDDRPSPAIYIAQDSPKDRAVKFAISAESKHTDGDYQGALEDYNQAIALNPDGGEYRNRGQLKHYRFNDSKGALADYNRAIVLAPNDAPSYYLRGKLKLESLKDSKGAIPDLTKALALAKKDNLGRLVSEAELALKDANKPKVKASRNAGATEKARTYIESAEEKRQSGDVQGAREEYDRAIEIDPLNADPYAMRGTLKMRLNDISGALIDFNRAVQIKPRTAKFHALRGSFKARETADKSGAISDLKMALSLEQEQGKNPRLIEAIQVDLKRLGVED